MVALDTGFLILFFGERGSDDDIAKVQHLIKTLDQSGSPVIIPTPVLAEYLVGAGRAMGEILSELRRRDIFRICAFDERAAVECAIAMRALRQASGKRGGSNKDWQAVKFDYQIAAIAKANGASRMYARDGGLRGFATALGIKSLDVSDLDLPPDAAQGKLKFEASIHDKGAQPSATTASPSEVSAAPERPQPEGS